MKNVLIVSKMTELEFNEFKFGAAVDSYYRKKKIDVERLKENHEYHYSSLNDIIAAFKDRGIRPGVIWRQNISQSDLHTKWDLIVPVGGDGTFMDLARYVLDDTLFFGVKSSPNSVGGHYRTNFSNAREHIDALLKGDFGIEKRARIKGLVRNEFDIEDLALNEVYIGDRFSAGYSSLELEIQGKNSTLGSSGMVFSTYHGRTGWYDNIPLKDYGGADFKEGEEGCIRYKIREKGRGDAEEYGIIRPGEKAVVVSRMLADGCATFDGNKPTSPRHRVYDLEYGNSVTIEISDRPLYVVKV